MKKSSKKTFTEYEGRQVETIDCTPTWRWAMSVYIASIAQDGYDAKMAIEELYRLADYCDSMIATSKLKVN